MAEVKMSPKRYARIRQLLALRQPSLTLCLEEVHKPHNVSAILRSCDAVGVHEIHAVRDQQAQIREATAMGSQNWVSTHEHANIESAVKHLKAQNMQVLVTSLSNGAVDFREVDYSLPTAIILGQERHGATEKAVELADQGITIPMLGMVQSLNVSVAAALILYEAQRQRQLKGMYDTPQLSEVASQRILFQKGFRELSKLCDRKEITYPLIDSNGCIDADNLWWKKVQLAD